MAAEAAVVAAEAEVLDRIVGNVQRAGHAGAVADNKWRGAASAPSPSPWGSVAGMSLAKKQGFRLLILGGFSAWAAP